MVLVIALGVLLGILAISMIGIVQSESSRSVNAVARDAAFQAAEAGIDDYTSKLVEDHLYYAHWVHPAEATRSGTAAGSPWTGGMTWTYPNGKDSWKDLGNGYVYDLQIAAPNAITKGVTITATGRPRGSSDLSTWRVVQTVIRPSSVSDFQMLSAADISYGSTATTYGKIYAGRDSAGVSHSVTHSGVAYGNIYAEGNINGTPTLLGGAQTYYYRSVRTVVKDPVNFSAFLTSLVTIQRASQAGGIYLSNPAVDAWKLTFASDGTVAVTQCMRSGSSDVALAQPTCGAATSYTVPQNGAIYSAQTVIVSGVVNGRVTVASNNNVVIPANITYAASGDDVLGLVAANDMLVAQWASFDLSWRAATISQSGAWKSYSGDGSHGTMTFTGSTTTNKGGSMSEFRTRVYQYDATLEYLQPPWFPTVQDAYTVLLTREMSPSR
jgi:hypothetical protein